MLPVSDTTAYSPVFAVVSVYLALLMKIHKTTDTGEKKIAKIFILHGRSSDDGNEEDGNNE